MMREGEANADDAAGANGDASVVDVAGDRDVNLDEVGEDGDEKVQEKKDILIHGLNRFCAGQERLISLVLECATVV
jgi:hypothetical protein